MAKAFSFSLQKVLDVRKHREEQKAIELGRNKAALNQEKMKLNSLHNNKTDALKEKSKEARRIVNLNALIVTQDYIDELNNKIKRQEQEVEKKSKKVSDSLKNLTEAMKKKRIVEILKDRKFEEFRKSANLTENKIIDEVAVRNANRNKTEKVK